MSINTHGIEIRNIDTLYSPMIESDIVPTGQYDEKVYYNHSTRSLSIASDIIRVEDPNEWIDCGYISNFCKQTVVDSAVAFLKCGGFYESNIPVAVKNKNRNYLTSAESIMRVYNKSIVLASQLTYKYKDIGCVIYLDLSNYQFIVTPFGEWRDSKRDRVFITTAQRKMTPYEIEKIVLDIDITLYKVYHTFSVTELLAAQNTCYLVKALNSHLSAAGFAAKIIYDPVEDRIRSSIEDIDRITKYTGMYDCGGYINVPLASEIAMMVQKREVLTHF